MSDWVKITAYYFCGIKKRTVSMPYSYWISCSIYKESGMGGIQLVYHISKRTFHRVMMTWVYFITNIIAPHRWMIFY